MNTQLLDRLGEITEEELNLKSGQQLDRSRYGMEEDFTVDSASLIKNGRLISLRPHTRFIHFPTHRHNYIEMIYMCGGSTVHIVDGKQILLNTGEILILNQKCVHEIFPADTGDIAVNFIIMPEFFDYVMYLMSDQENPVRDFIIRCIREKNHFSNYLYFKTAGVLPIQNLIENMVWSLLEQADPSGKNLQIYMVLLFTHLFDFTEVLEEDEGYEKNVLLQALRYIEENYREASFEELSKKLHMREYTLSRLIKSYTGRTFKEILRSKRMDRAVYLLNATDMGVNEIIAAVGYDNTSYFFKIFREKYGVSPGEFRRSNMES